MSLAWFPKKKLANRNRIYMIFSWNQLFRLFVFAKNGGRLFLDFDCLRIRHPGFANQELPGTTKKICPIDSPVVVDFPWRKQQKHLHTWLHVRYFEGTVKGQVKKGCFLLVAKPPVSEILQYLVIFTHTYTKYYIVQIYLKTPFCAALKNKKDERSSGSRPAGENTADETWKILIASGDLTHQFAMER